MRLGDEGVESGRADVDEEMGATSHPRLEELPAAAVLDAHRARQVPLAELRLRRERGDPDLVTAQGGEAERAAAEVIEGDLGLVVADHLAVAGEQADRLLRVPVVLVRGDVDSGLRVATPPRRYQSANSEPTTSASERFAQYSVRPTQPRP